MTTIQFTWPEGRSGALTASWDDGTVYDRRLVALHNQTGWKATWNLNSGKLGLDAEASGFKDYIAADEVRELYEGHEVASHTVSHPFLWTLPDAVIATEILEDRRALEALVGYPVTGFCLPFGDGGHRRRLIRVARSCGARYIRDTQGRNGFGPPEDPYCWPVAAHCSEDIETFWEDFLSCSRPDKIFYLWGHSYEFDERNEWERIERFLAASGSHPDLWKATNREILDYLEAWKQLEISTDGSLVRNRSAIPVWIKRGDSSERIDPANPNAA